MEGVEAAHVRGRESEAALELRPQVGRERPLELAARRLGVPAVHHHGRGRTAGSCVDSGGIWWTRLAFPFGARVPEPALATTDSRGDADPFLLCILLVTCCRVLRPLLDSRGDADAFPSGAEAVAVHAVLRLGPRVRLPLVDRARVVRQRQLPREPRKPRQRHLFENEGVRRRCRRGGRLGGEPRAHHRRAYGWQLLGG